MMPVEPFLVMDQTLILLLWEVLLIGAVGAAGALGSLALLVLACCATDRTDRSDASSPARSGVRLEPTRTTR